MRRNAASYQLDNTGLYWQCHIRRVKTMQILQILLNQMSSTSLFYCQRKQQNATIDHYRRKMFSVAWNCINFWHENWGRCIQMTLFIRFCTTRHKRSVYEKLLKDGISNLCFFVRKIHVIRTKWYCITRYVLTIVHLYIICVKLAYNSLIWYKQINWT